MQNVLNLLFIFARLLTLQSSIVEPPSFSEIFRKHDKEIAFRRANELKIYDKELSFYRNANKFPSLRLLQVGDDVSFAVLGDNATGGGGNIYI